MTTTTFASPLDAALRYARYGWKVLPCSPRHKIPPKGSHGLLDATDDPGQIRSWWEQTPDANIGVVTGSVSGIFVLDVDDESALLGLEAANGDLPRTLTARTGSGGVHKVFKYPDFEIRNSVKFNLTAEQRRESGSRGLDVRGDGGYIVVAPSIHPNGEVYKWVDGAPPSSAPAWLLDLIRKPPAPPPAPARPPVFQSGDGSAWGMACLSGELRELSDAQPGERNHLLFKKACRVYGAAKGGHLAESVATRELTAGGLAIGLPEWEVARTLRSALDTADPRQPEPLPDRRSTGAASAPTVSTVPVERGWFPAPLGTISGPLVLAVDRDDCLTLHRAGFASMLLRDGAVHPDDVAAIVRAGHYRVAVLPDKRSTEEGLLAIRRAFTTAGVRTLFCGGPAEDEGAFEGDLRDFRDADEDTLFAVVAAALVAPNSPAQTVTINLGSDQ